MKWLQTSAARCVNREEQEKKKIHAVCEVIVLTLQPKIVSCQKYIYVCMYKIVVGTAVCQAAWLTYCYFSFLKTNTLLWACST